jgi:opacity protein-like surface antigen
MKSRLLLAAAAAALFTTAADAQGWHAEFFGGGTWTPHLSLGPSSVNTDTGFNAGGRLGYDLDDWFGMSGLSLDADLFYTQSHLTATPARLSSLSMMGDLIYRVDLGLPVGVYGGGGVGAVRTMLNSPTVDDGSTVFGWQVLGGVDYQFTPNSTMFVEYRHLSAHDANIAPFTRVGDTSNNVSVGLKFDL